tara:strand:+ start:1463 stop:1720 length:258 start_codon:yes stop_codon:yes gene_type:complete
MNKKNNKFVRTWKNVEKTLPKYSDRFWCYVEKQNDLGKFYIQINCCYNKIENRWSNNFESCTVVFWTELGPRPAMEFISHVKPTS